MIGRQRHMFRSANSTSYTSTRTAQVPNEWRKAGRKDLRDTGLTGTLNRGASHRPTGRSRCVEVTASHSKCLIRLCCRPLSKRPLSSRLTCSTLDKQAPSGLFFVQDGEWTDRRGRVKDLIEDQRLASIYIPTPRLLFASVCQSPPHHSLDFRRPASRRRSRRPTPITRSAPHPPLHPLLSLLAPLPYQCYLPVPTSF